MSNLYRLRRIRSSAGISEASSELVPSDES